jgi:hypothetical protein
VLYSWKWKNCYCHPEDCSLLKLAHRLSARNFYELQLHEVNHCCHYVYVGFSDYDAADMLVKAGRLGPVQYTASHNENPI